jgi:hypothetical protein
MVKHSERHSVWNRIQDKELKVSQHWAGDLVHSGPTYSMRGAKLGAGSWRLMPVRRLLSLGLWFKASPGKELKGPQDKEESHIKW